ncbi:right-handed parallel beta-helix repeat-containing protein [Chitinivorax sp. B]|uniref:right-handed parallel beta-helix repeat-containing protein n=1 Tax=Chitinivorax sp. B TaxID=2502235 RepID=UPI0010F4FD67|nr:right-handed parallel beta-helix repeat-containing protein [Chitinivorax sp. B]
MEKHNTPYQLACGQPGALIPMVLAVGAALMISPAWAAGPTCAPLPGTSAVIYVGTNKVSGSGTIDSPYNQFDTAMGCARAGDTIAILGRFNLGKESVINRSKLTVRGQPRVYSDGNREWTEPSDVTCQSVTVPRSCLRIGGQRDIVIANLKLTGGERAPIDIGWGAHAVTVENNVLRHAPRVLPSNQSGYGLYVFGNQAAPSNGIVIRNNDVSSTNTGIYVNFVNELTLFGNIVHDVPNGDGVVVEHINSGLLQANTVNTIGSVVPGGTNCSPSLSAGIKLRESHKVDLVSNKVSEITGPGIQIRRVQYEPITDPRNPDMPASTGITIADNVIRHAVTFNSPANRPAGCPSGWPSAMVVSYVDRFVVERNTVHQNWGEGIAINTAVNGRVEANDVRDNFGVNLYLNNATNIRVLRNFAGYTDGVLGEPFHRFNAPAIGIGMANESQPDNPAESKNFRPLKDLVIANNIVRGGRAGINHYWGQPGTPAGQHYHASGLQNVRIFNNTVHGSWINAVIGISELRPQDVVPPYVPHQNIHLNANLFVQHSHAPLRRIEAGAQSAITYSSNAWFRTTPCKAETCPDQPLALPQGDASYDPLLAMPGHSEPKGYTLSNDSPARYASRYSFPEWDAAGQDFFGNTRRTAGKDVGAHEIPDNVKR